jgi:hypothetical protein
VDRIIIDDWKRQRIVYLCGAGLYDDWYWMLATVCGDKPPVAVRHVPGRRGPLTPNTAMHGHAP